MSQGVTAPSGGQWVARETASGGGSTYAYKSISPTVTDVYARFRFQVLSRTGCGRPDALPEQLGRQQAVAVGRRRDREARDPQRRGGTTTKSNVGDQHRTSGITVEVHGKIGSPSTTEVWLDGTLLPELGATGDLGTTNFGQFLLGQTGTTGTYDVVFDDVTVSRTRSESRSSDGRRRPVGRPSAVPRPAYGAQTFVLDRNDYRQTGLSQAHHVIRCSSLGYEPAAPRCHPSVGTSTEGWRARACRFPQSSDASSSGRADPSVRPSRPSCVRCRPGAAVRRSGRADRPDGRQVLQRLRSLGRVAVTASRCASRSRRRTGGAARCTSPP